MAGKYTLEEDNIKYSGDKDILFPIGNKISYSNYRYDEEGKILNHQPIVNAIDIDWQNAEVPGLSKKISSTSDLLSEISKISKKAIDTSKVPYVGENGNWWIDENDTGISAEGQDGVTPHLIDGKWYIGDTYICDAIYIPSGVASDGIPIYDSEMLIERGSSLPDKYISINEDDSLTSPSNQSQLEILFATVNALQEEVNKLKAGIYSYNNKATHMSATMKEYGDDDIEEPLWAIDESDLDEIEDFNFDVESSSIFEDNGILNDCEEQRMFAYITADSSDVEITLRERNNQSLDISFNFNHYINCEKCNIMLIVSRKPEDREYPANYIYFTITDYVTNYTLIQGYLNNELNLVNTQFNLNKRYYIHKVDMSNANPSKFNVYVDDKALGNEVKPNIPEDDGTCRVAHIAIRSCTNYQMILEISKQLVNNELIFDEQRQKLYIKSNNKIINIGAGGTPEPDDEDTIMTNQEIIKALEAQGIITITFKDPTLDIDEEKYALENIHTYALNKIGSFNMIHEDSGKEFEFTTNAYGELESKLVNEKLAKSFTDYINEYGINLADNVIENVNGVSKLKFSSYRGVMSQIGLAVTGKTISENAAKDMGLWSDRLKIGSIYAPLDTDVIHGCSHAYVEIENTSDIDIDLTGCYLHYIRIDLNKNPLDDTEDTPYVLSSLPLKGIIKGGSTYLIRGKQYANKDEINCYIYVDEYDQEWYYQWTDNSSNVHKELIDFTIHNGKYSYIYQNIAQEYTPSYVFAISYGNIVNLENNIECLGCKSDKNVSFKLMFLQEKNDANENAGYIKNSNVSYYYPKGFIDAIAINSPRYGIPDTGQFTKRPNSIYKNTFELDPAKQAFNSLSKIDSSRSRWQNAATDLMTVCLNNRYIDFPKSTEKYDVTYFAPKASKQNKNVCTDKTKFNKEKPNAVTVSFGENIYTTRCFNWLSGTYGDEYIWIYDNDGNFIKRFESYKYTASDIQQENSYPRRKEFPANVNNIIYCDYRVNDVIDRARNNIDVSYKEFALAERACGLFAGSKDFYISHKCIIEFASVTDDKTKTTYKYIVGKSDKHGNPILENCSEVRTFNIYPERYIPKIYQITDQQGFQWIEYQVWAAAAIKLNEKIEADIAGKEIIPIIINTGDCTQSGSRINEWLDYFNAGDVLFNHFEQNNLVGNNDLNGTDVQFLGTGDDPGKSNAYYFYLFNCNDANIFFTDENEIDHYAIVNNTYVPSLYYIQTKELRLLLMNSEITTVNCRDWFNLRQTSGNSLPINIYTGWPINENNKGTTSLNIYYTDESISYSFDTSAFTPLYTLVYHALEVNKDENDNHKVITFCHEMPFTVITKDSLSNTPTEGIFNQYRSMSTKNALIGSHLNHIDKNDLNTNGLYWFSRLLEWMQIKVCIGGHKHTYAVTYPLREHYKYYDDNEETWKYSRIDGPMPMGTDLSNDKLGSTIIWSWVPSEDEYQWKEEFTNTTINFSKFPITYIEALLNVNSNDPIGDIRNAQDNSIFLPSFIIDIKDAEKKKVYSDYSNNFVTYIMCQATGYKFASNKELPSNNQKFSRIIPKTNHTASGDKPHNSQKYPMFGVYELKPTNNTLLCKIGRIENIFSAAYTFTQYDYSTADNAMEILWLSDKNDVSQPYGQWQNDETPLFNSINL